MIESSQRKIIHVDLDAFYPSVEQRDNPSLQGKPVIVGGDPKGRGVVASASYEARQFGVKSAMSCATAFRRCPQGIFVYPNFDKYVKASHQIREIFRRVTPLVEPLSLDEAYLDVTENLLNEPLAKNIAQYIKDCIRTEVGLTASAGVGPNKFIAKLASDHKKPNGLVVVPPQRVAEFIENLAVEQFWGVGPATAKKLRARGIITARDIRTATLEELHRSVGNFAQFLFDLAHGKDDREVCPEHERKSCGTETTFDKDVQSPEVLLGYIQEQAQEVSEELKKYDRPGKTVTVKIKYSDFSSITRSRTLFHPTTSPSLIAQTASELLFKETEVAQRPVRLIGVSVSNLLAEDEPLQLWFEFGA